MNLTATTQLAAEVLTVACWTTVTATWLARANPATGKTPTRKPQPPRELICAAALAIAVLTAVPAHVWRTLEVRSMGTIAAGALLLLASTSFALAARRALGEMWSGVPGLMDQHRLCTSGPYGVTRHPIYTGVLGMLTGSILIAGVGHWLAVPLAALALLTVKIRLEEQLLAAAFPDQYTEYRAHVPRLVSALQRRRPAATGVS